MTQKDKELLLKDLCARLIYGIFVKENHESLDNRPTIYTLDYHPCIDNCKPYLRPMSSMTKEEENEYNSLNAFEKGTFPHTEEAFDYLVSYHFDYRCLIPMGLALEAPKGMYDIK